MHTSAEAPDPPLVQSEISAEQQAIRSAATNLPTTRATRQLVKATPKDLRFVDSLQKKFGRSLGFLPTQALEVNLEAGNVTLTNENDDAAGYMLVRPILSWQPGMASIVQAAVCMDAQRRHHGLALLLLLEQQARDRGQVALQANCAIGVEANEFWQAAGFKPIAHMTPQTKSQREIICWRKALQRSLPSWFTVLPAKAGGRSLPVNSTRNANRPKRDTDFASKFIAPKILIAGDVCNPANGYLRSLQQLEERMATDGDTNQ